MMQADPHNYLNEKNAIMLNCKNSQIFHKVYEEAIKVQLADQLRESRIDGGLPNVKLPERQQKIWQEDNVGVHSDHEEE